jgi:hypothetical protein
MTWILLTGAFAAAFTWVKVRRNRMAKASGRFN